MILGGEATLELWPSPRRGRPARSGRRSRCAPATWLRDRPGPGVLALVAGAEGVTMLVYGTRRPNDMCWYPRSRKLSRRGLGVIGRIEALDYFDGEPED